MDTKNLINICSTHCLVKAAKPFLLVCAAVSPLGWSERTIADQVLGLSAGATFWRGNLQNEVQSNNFLDSDGALVAASSFSAYEMNIADSSQVTYFLEYRPGLPFFPNIKYVNAPINETGRITTIRTINFVDAAIPPDTDVESEFDLSHQDITLYLSVLDSWMLLDIGVTQRTFDGRIALTYLPAADPDDPEAEAPTLTTSSSAIDSAPVLFYGHGEIPVFSTDWKLLFTLNYRNEEQEHFSDNETRLAYTLEKHGFDYTVEFGYKSAKYIANDFGDLSSALISKGPFIRVSLGL